MKKQKRSITINEKEFELTDEQLAAVTGGEDLSLSAVPIIYLKCAVDSMHIWPHDVDACPVCGSTEFIRTVVPE